MCDDGCKCNHCFKIGGNPEGDYEMPPPKPEPPQNRIIKEGETPENPNPHVQFILKAARIRNENPFTEGIYEAAGWKGKTMNKKLNVLGYIKWIWNFSPVMWGILFAIALPIVVGVMAGCACKGAVVFLIEILIGVLGVGVYSVWDCYGKAIKNHCKDWYRSKPSE